MSEIISKQEFHSEMKRNGFVVNSDGEVVCDLCSSDCGQCGACGHMYRCQQYVDANREKFVRDAPRWVKITLLVFVILAVVLESVWWYNWR